MEKLTERDGQSVDIVRDNIAALKSLFPEIVTDGKIDFDTLRTVLGDDIEPSDERYGLNWHGKQRARRIAQTPSTGTLRPCPEESVDWDTTQNIFIEGDNLEVLKLLQKSYHRRIKMIYIDPPYNTGKEFIYPDKFADNLDTYLRYTGQKDGDGSKLTANAETNGRYHTNWLNMMYPRLRLARNLLRDDGVIFVSIDDHEVHSLRALMDEVFGAENLVGMLVWRARVSEDTRAKSGLSTDHEYLLCFRKSDEGRLRGTDKDTTKFSNPDNDPRGPWRSADLTGLAPKERRPNLHYDLVDPSTSTRYQCPLMGWRYEPSTMSTKIAEGRILWPSSTVGRPRHKLFLNEMRSTFKNTSSILSDTSTSDGTRELNDRIGVGIFSFPKPTALIRFLIEQTCDSSTGDIVLDFFAGSGTSGDAVIQLNAEDSGNRKFIIVQLPEPTGRDDFATIAEITKARLNAASKTVSDPVDLGFRVFKLATSNLKPWDGTSDTLANDLLAAIDHIKPDRTEDDLLYELLLKFGLDLASPIDRRTLHGKQIHIIGAGALIVCLQPDLSLDVIDAIAGLKTELQPEVMRVVFRDACFANDVIKANAVQILRHAGIDDIKSL